MLKGRLLALFNYRINHNEPSRCGMNSSIYILRFLYIK
nr:MAG TPA: hypothetical protein [Bacteriophage sp.]